MNTVEKAEIFAIAAHEAVTDKRKYTGEPASVHHRAVAERLKALGYDDETVAAGWLHDVIEDTGVTQEVLRQFFSQKTCDIVFYSTQVAFKGDGTRKERSTANNLHYATGIEESQSLKLCDSMDNTPSMTYHNPKFAQTYVREKYHLHSLMTKAHPDIIQTHAQMLADCSKHLGLSAEAPSFSRY